MNDKEKLLLLADQIEMLPLPRLDSSEAQTVKMRVIKRIVETADEIRQMIDTL